MGGEGEYARAKRFLNRGSHPTFVGRDMVERQARNGGLSFVTYDGADVAVSITNAAKGVLYVFNVAPVHRGHGLGTALCRYFSWNLVRATEDAAPWFGRQGYVAVGDWIQGRSLCTRVMVRERLFDLAGRLQNLDLLCNRDSGDTPESESATVRDRPDKRTRRR